MNKKLEKRLEQLPTTPGVYLHKDKDGKIIYVGKAAVLRNRVRQYFQKSRLRDTKTDLLVADIADVDWIEVDSELDALFLEAELVRRYLPKYNILLRDDKSSTYVRINMQDEYPFVSYVRRPLDDGATYIGPFFTVGAVRKALRVLRKAFPYSTHRTLPPRVCLQYHLGLCPGVEGGKISSKEYKKQLRQLIRYLQGDRKKIVKQLEKEMQDFATKQNFEMAAKRRNQLNIIKSLSRQIIFGDSEFLDISKDYALNELADLLTLPEPPKRIEGYDISHMSGTNVVASMVVFINGLPAKAEYRKFKVAQKNDDFHNIYEAVFRRLADKHLHDWGKPDLLLIDGGKGQLDAALRAQAERGTKIPMVGLAKRNDEIIIKLDDSLVTVRQADANSDWIVTEKDGFININLHPGQFKTSDHSSTLHGEGTAQSYVNLLKLLQRIRDESHRFAISYHTSLKRAGQTRSQLEDIPGVGPATRKKLIKAFSSAQGVKDANQSEIAKAVGLVKAKLIFQHFHNSSVL